jgi:hypothetical protein
MQDTIMYNKYGTNGDGDSRFLWHFGDQENHLKTIIYVHISYIGMLLHTHMWKSVCLCILNTLEHGFSNSGTRTNTGTRS